ncbi:MAG: ASCH domain-containing protein [Halobellus sp.]
MSEIDAADLLPNDRVQQSVLDGDVTQLTRGASNRYADEGDTFELDGETFEVTSVERRTLGDFTDADARREGSESLSAYKRRMERVHPGDFEWDDSDEVLTYRFERVD